VEAEFARIRLTGGKVFALITAISTFTVGAYVAFEVYKQF